VKSAFLTCYVVMRCLSLLWAEELLQVMMKLSTVYASDC